MSLFARPGFGRPNPLARYTTFGQNIHFDDDDEDGGGSGSPMTLQLPKELADLLKSKASNEGSWEALATLLHDDNRKLREKLRNVTKAPKGAVIITEQTEIDAYSKIKQVGTLVEVAAKLDSIPALEEKANKLDSRSKEESARNAFEKAGLNPDAVAAIPGALDLEYTVTVGKDRDNKAIDIVTVKRKNGDGSFETVGLDQHASEKWAIYKPILAAPDPDDDDDDSDDDDDDDAPVVLGNNTSGGGLRIPKQTATGSGGKGGKKKKGGKGYANAILDPLNKQRSTRDDK